MLEGGLKIFFYIIEKKTETVYHAEIMKIP